MSPCTIKASKGHHQVPQRNCSNQDRSNTNDKENTCERVQVYAVAAGQLPHPRVVLGLQLRRLAVHERRLLCRYEIVWRNRRCICSHINGVM